MKNILTCRPLLPALYAAAGLVCLYFFVSFLFYILTSYWPGPFHDYWFEIPKIQDFFAHHLSWTELVTAHANAHRLVIPRLVFIADYVFFRGSNELIVVVSILCKLAMLLLLNSIIKNEGFKTRLLLNTLIFAALFNAINIPNILNSSNVQWDLMALFSCLAIYFYSNAYLAGNRKKIIFYFLAYLFFVCAFFSQGGSLPVVFVFLLIAILNRSLVGTVSSILFIGLMYYLMDHVLPVNDEDAPGMMNAIAMFIFKPKYVSLYVLKLMSANVYNLETFAFIFSGWSLLLLSLGLYFHKKTAPVANNALLYIACFALIMMVLIAAFRVDFAPTSWISNRYHPNVLLFILALHLNAFLLAGILCTHKWRLFCRGLLLASCMVNFGMPQYFQYSTAGDFANIVFETQTSGLYYGPSQTSARRLVTSVHDFDKIAEADPFFREYGFAYYSNKQKNGEQAKKPGELLIAEPQLADFAQRCPVNTATVAYTKTEDGTAYTFSTIFNSQQNSLIAALFTRNTFYALDDHGQVLGFAWFYVNAEAYWSSARLEGLTRAAAVKYIAEISDNQLICRYRLDTGNL
jgi:hypothetical protein